MSREHRTIAEHATAHRYPELDPHPTPAEQLRRAHHHDPTQFHDLALAWGEQVAEARAWLRAAAYVVADRRAWTPTHQDMTGISPLDLWADRLEVDGRPEDAEEVRAFAERITAVEARTPDGRVRPEPPTNQFTAPMAVVHRFPTRTTGDPA